MGKLSAKRRKFVEEYCIDFNASAAAVRAGYSKRCARQLGSRLLTYVDIAEAVTQRAHKLQERAEVTVEEILRFWAELLRDKAEGRDVQLGASDRLAKFFGMFTNKIQVTGSLTLVDLLLAADRKVAELPAPPEEIRH
jgi:phage terminase small subunit